MTHFLFCWEYGSGFGHIHSILAIAKHLSVLGHRLTFVIKDINIHESLIRQHIPHCTLLAIPPHKPHSLKIARKPHNYAELLLMSGFNNEQEIKERIFQWSNVFLQQKPDCVIFDNSPNALIAAMSYTFKKINTGNPFSLPPILSPLPPLYKNIPANEPSLLKSEEYTLNKINRALGDLNLSKISRIGDIFSVDHTHIITYPELDLYAQYRTGNTSYGHIMDSSLGQTVIAWPSKIKTKRRIVGYLKKSPYSAFNDFVSAVKELNLEANIFVSDLSDEEIHHISSDAIRFTNKPFKLDKGLEDIDAFVCHSGVSICAFLLYCGIPCFNLPLHQEQLTTAEACLKNKIGGGTSPHSDKEKIIEKLTELFDSKNVSDNCKKISQHYQETIPRLPYQPLIDKCIELVE